MWIPPFLATPEAVQHAASRHNSELYSAGRACVALTKLAATPQSVYSLAGRLVGSKSGYLLLEVPNALVRGAFDALHEPGAELPPDLNAHITVMRKDEIEQIGGLDKVTERGHTFKYQLGPIQTVNPSGWAEFNKCWYIRVRSPELEKLRKTYGLPAKPNNNEHDFHITIAVRKTTVIQENEVSKAADHTTLMADIKSRTEPAGSQKAARDLVLRAIEGRYGLEKTAGSEMKGLIDLEGVDDSILPHVKIHGDMEHTYSNGVPCTGKKITASRGSISKLSAATKPGYYSLLFNDRNAVVIFDDAVFHLPRADIRSSPRFEQALQHANSKDIPAFYMNELENTFWNDAPIKQAMLPSATTPWLPARLEIEKLKQQGVPVKGTGNLAASPEIRQQLADTLPAAHLQHIDPSKLEPELLAGMNRHPISKMMIDSSRPRGHIILGSNSKNPMLDMRNPNLVAPILQHEGDEARFAGTGQRVVSDTGNNLTELAAPGQTQMQRIGVASKLMQGGVAHNDPRILLNESHRIASGETHPAAARILEDARRSTGEYAFLHGLGIQYGKTPLPEGGRAYNKAIQRWAEKVPRTVSTNPYDPSRSLVYHDILPNLATKQKQEKAYLTKQLPGGGTSITPPNKYFPVGKAPGTITTPPIDKSLDDTLSELLKNPNVRKVMFPHRELPSLRTPPTPAAIGKAPGSLITPPPVPSPLTMPKQADEHIGHYKPKEKVTRQAFGYLPPKGDHDQFAQCGTCRAFTGPDHNTCMILGKEHVTADMSCNYYQHGNPSPSGAGKEHRVLTPKQAGLVDRQVRCENCAFFDKEGSYCELYEHLTASHPQQFDLDEHVDPKGCCNFQTPKGEKVEEEAKEAALWYLKDELSKEKEASANRISLTLIDRGQEKRSALSNNSAINIGAGVGGLALAATGGAMLYQGWNQPGQSWLEQGHQLWKEPENHDRLTEALGDHQSAQEMISMATIRPKVFQNLLAGQPQIGIDPEMQQRVRELTFGQNKEHMKSIPGDLMISGSRNGALGHLQPLATGSSAMHTDVGGIHGGDWLGLWTRWANHPKSTKAYFKDNPSIRVSPWDKAPADRYRIGLRPREDFAQPIDRKKLQQWLTSEKHPFGEQRFAEVAMNELLPEFKTQTGHSFGGIARLLAGNSSVKKMFAGSKMPQAYQKLIDQGYSPEHAAEVCSSFAARAIHKFNPKLIPGKYRDYSPHDIARLAEPGGPYKIHQMELPEKLMTPDELESEHRRIKWGPLLGRLPIAAALLGGGGYLAHKAFGKSSAEKKAIDPTPRIASRAIAHAAQRAPLSSERVNRLRSWLSRKATDNQAAMQDLGHASPSLPTAVGTGETAPGPGLQVTHEPGKIYYPPETTKQLHNAMGTDRYGGTRYVPNLGDSSAGMFGVDTHPSVLVASHEIGHIANLVAGSHAAGTGDRGLNISEMAANRYVQSRQPQIQEAYGITPDQLKEFRRRQQGGYQFTALANATGMHDYRHAFHGPTDDTYNVDRMAALPASKRQEIQKRVLYSTPGFARPVAMAPIEHWSEKGVRRQSLGLPASTSRFTPENMHANPVSESGSLASKDFSKSSAEAAYQHGLKVVKVKRRDKEVLLCPHCGKEVEDKDLYRDAKGWVFHRPCFVKGKGSIKLSASLDNAAPAQRLRDIAATLSKRAFSGGLGSNPVSGMSATDPPRPTERDGSSQAAKVTLGGSLFDTMAGTSETQQPLDDVGVSYRTATPASGQPSMAAGAQGRTAMASGAGQAYSNAPGSAALAAPSAGTSGQEDEIDEDLGDMNVDPESSTAAYGQIPHLDGPGGFVP